LNRFVRERERWTAAEMEERSGILAQQALRIWPPLSVTEDSIRQSRQEDLRRLASKGSLEKVEMTADAKRLLNAIRAPILALDAGIIELANTNSVSYHAADADFFVELLPRKHRVLVLLNLDLSECEYRDERLRDALDYKFLANATNEGAAFYELRDVAQIDGAMKLVRQAYGLAAQ